MAKRFAIKGLAVLGGLIISTSTFAQTNNLDGTVGAASPAVPFLRISPDARSGAMGDVGLAISPDANAQYWNVGKLAMSEKEMGVSVTYTPWLKALGLDDMFLGYVSAYKKFGENNNQAISASLRYFNLGNIDYTTIDATPAGTGKPREFAFDVGYSRKLSENLSLGVALRYIHSNIAAGSQDINATYSPGNAFAGDIGVFYTKTNQISEYNSGTFSFGAQLSNVGSKISYSNLEKDFIPTNLGIGAAYTYQIDEYNKITGSLDLNKLLIPSAKYENGKWNRPTESVVGGMLSSFTQAPGGYGTVISIGGEYWYQDQFAIRAGYFYEHPDNGARQYFTCGLGIKYNTFGLNFAYLVPAAINQGDVPNTAKNPLANTLRFSLTFDFDNMKKKG